MGAGQGKHLIRHIILSLFEEVGSQSKALEKQNQIRLTPSFQKKSQQSLGDQHEKQLKKKKIQRDKFSANLGGICAALSTQQRPKHPM